MREEWRDTPVAATHKKRVWLLWLQGWDVAPPIAHEVRASYERWNPGWTVECVCEADVAAHVKIPYLSRVPTAPAKSDVIRLALLDAHGGVWADATMLCLAPLDAYVYDALAPSGFWMYHGRDNCTGPASWFMASVPGSTIARKWREACDSHWNNERSGGASDYFWMDALFKRLYDGDTEFAASWDRVPHLCCEDPGQAHAIAGRTTSKDADVQRLINANPPYALKLSRHGLPDDPGSVLGDNNMGAAIARSRDVARGPGTHVLGPARADFTRDAWQSRTILVLSDCGHDLHAVIRACHDAGAQAVVYDKCAFCAAAPPGVRCRPLANVGRESETFLRFVIQHYANLPDEVLLIAGNMDKHNRIERITALLAAHKDATACHRYDDYGFEIINYEGSRLFPATVRPFGNWFEHFIGLWQPTDDNGACWNGIMRTTRVRILRHPMSFFQRLHAELSTANAPEAGHYVERSMAAIF
jgi:hypothetical protein